MRLATASALAIAAALTLAAPLANSAESADNGGSDYTKKAGNFLQNCDARKDADGQRPDPPNFVCLAFLAGLVEGYNYGAIANGNPKPYCLPRPVSLAELSDMLTTVIERGVKPDMATAAVFHFLMEENFKCRKDASLRDADEGIIVLAQASEQLLRVTPPAELEASQPKLPIVTPSSEGLLPIVGGTGSAPSDVGEEPETLAPVGEIAPPGSTSAEGGTAGTTGPTSSPTATTTAPEILLPQPTWARPVRPATPSRPVGPQGPRRAGE